MNSKTTSCHRAPGLLAAAFALSAGGGAAALAQTSTTVTTTAPAGNGAPAQVTTTTTKQNADGSTIVVTVNNQPVQFPENSRPVMMGGRVMVPLRGVVEKLGGNILYDANSKVITGAHADSSAQFRLRVGSNEALLNGKQMNLDTPPRVIAGTTYVPLRFVSEALGATVRWDNASRTVIIGSGGHTAAVSTGPTSTSP